MRFAPSGPGRSITQGALAALAFLALLAGAGQAFAQDQGSPFEDYHFTGNLGLEYSNGSYGTSRNTNVEIGLPSLSVDTGNFRFNVSVPYMRISGRGLVVFDAAGNAVVINRRTTLPPDVRTGWGDLNLSATYAIPPSVLGDFDVKVTGTTKVPTGSEQHRLSTGAADFGVSVDVSRNSASGDRSSPSAICFRASPTATSSMTPFRCQPAPAWNSATTWSPSPLTILTAPAHRWWWPRMKCSGRSAGFATTASP